MARSWQVGTSVLVWAFAGLAFAQTPATQPAPEAPPPVATPTTLPASTVETPTTGPAVAPPPAKAAPPPADFWHRSRMTGDWGGVRTKLEDMGFKLDLYYNHIYGVNAKGGADTTNAQRQSGTADLFLTFDFEKMGLIPGGSLTAFSKSAFSRNINDKVAALSDPFDDADDDDSIYLGGCYYQQRLLADKLRLRFGYLDYQLIIDRNAYAAFEDVFFMTTNLDNNPLVPRPIGLGATLFVDPVPWLGLTFGASDKDARLRSPGFDTTFHDGAEFFGFGELELRPKIPSSRGPLTGHYRFGTFYDPATKEEIGSRGSYNKRRPRYQTGDVGYYLSFDQLAWREGPADEQGLGLFFRWGWRDEELNRTDEFWSGGAQYQGLIPHRNDDVLGFGMYAQLGSDRYKYYTSHDFRGELGYELYYKIQLTPWLTLTPDFQYIVDAGGHHSDRDAVVVGLRMRVIF